MELEKKLNFDRIKEMSKSIRFTTKGYIRECESLFPKDNSYYNIPELITFLILLYLDEPECFEINNEQIYQHNGGSGYFYHIFGKTKVDRKHYNKYQWFIETDETFEGRLGIINDTNNAVSKSKNGESLYRHHETVTAGSKQYSDSGSEWKGSCNPLSVFVFPGDTIIITLDYSKNSVCFKSHLGQKDHTVNLKEGVEIVRCFVEFLSRGSIIKLKSNI